MRGRIGTTGGEEGVLRGTARMTTPQKNCAKTAPGECLFAHIYIYIYCDIIIYNYL